MAWCQEQGSVNGTSWVYIICDTTYMEFKKHITNFYLLFMCVHAVEIKKNETKILPELISPEKDI